MSAQPDNATCGPTCLHAVYRYYGDDISLEQVIDEVVPLETGGTLAVLLGCHALRRGYRATMHTYNLRVFDPTWFEGKETDLRERLRAQAEAKDDPKLRIASLGYQEFLTLGGRIRFDELTPALIRRYLKRDRPILTGLSSTYLYRCAREAGNGEWYEDDVRGEPTGHFVVLSGYDLRRREVAVADPLQDNPRFGSHYYSVSILRALGAILLGVLTYDGNLLILEPTSRRERS